MLSFLDGIQSYIPERRIAIRTIRCALSLTLCTALILHHETSVFLGPNVFLIGTVAIYLFPKSTIGAQMTATTIASIGFFMGLGWYNIVSRDPRNDDQH